MPNIVSHNRLDKNFITSISLSEFHLPNIHKERIDNMRGPKTHFCRLFLLTFYIIITFTMVNARNEGMSQ